MKGSHCIHIYEQLSTFTKSVEAPTTLVITAWTTRWPCQSHSTPSSLTMSSAKLQPMDSTTRSTSATSPPRLLMTAEPGTFWLASGLRTMADLLSSKNTKGIYQSVVLNKVYNFGFSTIQSNNSLIVTSLIK